METKLVKIRKEKGLSQSQLAERSGVHPKAISKLERGERPLSNLRLSTALALADALQVDPHQLIDD